MMWRRPTRTPSRLHDVPPQIPAAPAAHQLAAWRGLLQVQAQATQQLDVQVQVEHGLSISSDASAAGAAALHGVT